MIYFPKSQPAPASLPKEGYRCAEVLDRLQADFHDKCYLCEQKNPTNINVEHFIPHRGNEAIKLSWDNLFWVCGHCNNTKEQIEKGADSVQRFLDCSQEKQDVLNWIKYCFTPIAKASVNLENKCTDVTFHNFTENTIKLLNAIYNGTTPLKTKESENLKRSLRTEIDAFYKVINEYYDDPQEMDKPFLLRNIKTRLSKKSAFTAFKRWIILENSILKAEFEKYFD